MVKIEAGSIIMAEPFMIGPEFKESVVLITEHSDENGTVGFVINRSLELKMNELIQGFPLIDLELHYGGPVQTDTLHFIHIYGHILKDSIPIKDNLFWGGDFEQLKVLIQEKTIKESGIRFYLGYSGWSEGQLMDEFEEGTWMKSDLDINYLFNMELNRVWKHAVSDLGNKFEVISRMPKLINWN